MTLPDGFNVQVLVKGVPALTVGTATSTVTSTEACEEHPFDVVVLVTV
jgi:hypothetical protein